MRFPRPAEHDEIHKCLGILIIRWNHLEALSQIILNRLAGGGRKIDVLTVHMGNVSVAGAIGVLATEFEDEPRKTHLLHFLKIFDILRVKRNYYIHGAGLIGEREGETVSVVQTVKAKGRLTITTGVFRSIELENAITEIEDALGYASAIINDLYGAMRDPAVFPPLASLGIPPLPDAIQMRTVPLLDE